ncbi:MAG: molecular chaperone [Comamonadaceae bacterium]|nr:MAG: molecular chaperone [Comamonadaceae bacterium]
MRLKRALLAVAFAAWLGTFTTASATAASLHVAPVRIALTGARPVASLTLGNGEDEEVAIQVEVLAWSQRDGQDHYAPTRDVLVNPSIFRVPARGQQIVRMGLQVAAADEERSYRVFFQQLPRDQALPADAAGSAGARLQTLLRIGVPLFVPAAAARQSLHWKLTPAAWAEGGTHRLWLDNRGTDHLQLTEVRLRHEGGAELLRKSLSWYVLPGRSASIALDLPVLPPDTTLQLELASDAPSALPAVRLRVPRADAAPR